MLANNDIDRAKVPMPNDVVVESEFSEDANVTIKSISVVGEGTKAIAEAIAKSSAFSVAGGGDTLAAIDKYGIAKDVSYISTGGGAFLEFVEGKKLPAVEILERRAASC